MSIFGPFKCVKIAQHGHTKYSSQLVCAVLNSTLNFGFAYLWTLIYKIWAAVQLYLKSCLPVNMWTFVDIHNVYSELITEYWFNLV